MIPALIAAVLTLGLVSSVFATPLLYSAKAIEARVVDHETDAPIPDTTIAALWILESLGGQLPRLHVADAVTDASGRFVLPAWGPKVHPPLTEFRYRAPILVVFRHGYHPLRLHNATRAEFALIRSQTKRTAWELDRRFIQSLDGNPDDTVQEAVWDSMTIRLEPFRGDLDKWLEALRTVRDEFRHEDTRYVLKVLNALLAERSNFTGWKDPAPIPGIPPLYERFFGSLDGMIRQGERK